MVITQLLKLSCITFLVSTTACSKVLGPNTSGQSLKNSAPAGQKLMEPESQSFQPAEESDEESKRSQQLIAQVIQTQFGPEGTEVDLTSAKVTGQVMTVALRYRKTPESHYKIESSYPIEEVSYTDDATSRQYTVLQNQSGSWLASPKNDEGEIDLVFSYGTKSQVAWFKFPAPPPEAQTISINIPNVSPFDGVKIER